MENGKTPRSETNYERDFHPTNDQKKSQKNTPNHQIHNTEGNKQITT